MKVITALAIVGALSIFSTMAAAAPMGAETGNDFLNAANDASPNLILVAGHCGRGYHRDRFGVCRRNLAPGEGECWWVRHPHHFHRWRLVCR
jgi:hypothetical protein